jgi:hypothetical protein
MASRYRGHNPFSVQLQADPSRSIFVQQLLARALQNNGRPSRSVAESADIASAPIIAALLAKQDQKSQAQQMTQQKALANQLVGGAMRTNIPLENLDGQPADNYSVPTEGPTGANRSALAGILAQNPQMMGQMAAMQAMPKPPPQPEQYTLSPGQSRMQGNQVVASMPANPANPPNISWHDAGDSLVPRLPDGSTPQGVQPIPKVNPDDKLFSGPVGDLMASLTEKGYQMPIGVRSKAQQAATFEGILKRHQGEDVEDIANNIVSGKIGLMTQTEAAKQYSSTRPNTAGGQLIAINTAVKHIESALPLVDALQTGDVRIINQARNAFEKNVGGGTAPTDFNILKEFINGEVSKAVFTSGGGEQERQALKASVDAANSPQAIKSAFQKVQVALAGKTDAYRQRWDEVTQGNQGDFNKFLLPETIKALGSGQTQQQGGGMPDLSKLSDDELRKIVGQ